MMLVKWQKALVFIFIAWTSQADAISLDINDNGNCTFLFQHAITAEPSMCGWRALKVRLKSADLE